MKWLKRLSSTFYLEGRTGADKRNRVGILNQSESVKLKLKADTCSRSFVTFIGAEFKCSFVLGLQNQTCQLRFGSDYRESGVYNSGGALGKQLTAWKSNCSTVSPFPSPAPQTGICSFYATPPESTAAGSTCRPISCGWASFTRERGRDTQNRLRHPLEVVWGSRWVETLADKWQQSALTYRVN